MTLRHGGISLATVCLCFLLCVINLLSFTFGTCPEPDGVIGKIIPPHFSGLTNQLLDIITFLNDYQNKSQPLCLPGIRTEISKERFERFSNIFNIKELSFSLGRNLRDCECDSHNWERKLGWLEDWEILGHFLDAVHPFLKKQISDQFLQSNHVFLNISYNVLHLKMDNGDVGHYHWRFDMNQSFYMESMRRCYLKLVREHFSPDLPIYVIGTHPRESIFPDLVRLGYRPMAKPLISLKFSNFTEPNNGRELNALAEAILLSCFSPPKKIILNYGSTFSHWLQYRHKNSEIILLDLEAKPLCTLKT